MLHTALIPVFTIRAPKLLIAVLPDQLFRQLPSGYIRDPARFTPRGKTKRIIGLYRNKPGFSEAGLHLLERKPCFTLEGKNIVLIQRFNAYIALMFCKGALLSDPNNLMCRIGEHMQTPRQLRFGNVAEVMRVTPTFRSYIEEAMALQRAGAKVPVKKGASLSIPEELQSRLDSDPALKRAFGALTPGRQKGYIFQIAGAKQASTRAARVEKYVAQILASKGLND